MILKDEKESGGRRASKSNASESSAWSLAMRWLGHRDRSAAETKEYLCRHGYAAGVVCRVVDRLRLQGFVDDRRLASQRAEHWLRRGFGQLRARAELEARGVAEEYIAAALAAVFEGEKEVARELIGRRFPRAHLDEKVRARASRFLLARGFPQEVVVVLLGEPC